MIELIEMIEDIDWADWADWTDWKYWLSRLSWLKWLKCSQLPQLTFKACWCTSYRVIPHDSPYAPYWNIWETQVHRNPAAILWDDRLRVSPRRWIPELPSTWGNMRFMAANLSIDWSSAATRSTPPATGGSTLVVQESRTPAPATWNCQPSLSQGDHTLVRTVELHPF